MILIILTSKKLKIKNQDPFRIFFLQHVLHVEFGINGGIHGFSIAGVDHRHVIGLKREVHLLAAVDFLAAAGVDLIQNQYFGRRKI